jgi:hypothetical protein
MDEALKAIGVDLAQPVICTWVELARAMADLHRWEKAPLDELHDIWLKGVPTPDYRVAVPGAVFDERRPRPGDVLKHIVPPLPIARWIEQISARRGFPYSAKQAIAITQGQVEL